MYGSVKNGMKMDMVATDMAEAIGRPRLTPETGGTKDIGTMTKTMVTIGSVAVGKEIKDN